MHIHDIYVPQLSLQKKYIDIARGEKRSLKNIKRSQICALKPMCVSFWWIDKI